VSETLEREIAALPKMNIAQLRAKWRSSLKQTAPPHVRKQLLVPLLAYKLQEQVYGGLKPEIRRQLEKIALRYRRDPSTTDVSFRQPRRIKPGTRLLRHWNGKSHQVTVIDDGFEYEGERYESLSVIARKITGTRWSGPLFFGLKGTRS
jgi:Protein of unknown function (DUF2924)